MDDRVLSWCKRLIGCRSVTNEGTRGIVELCARELLAPHGIATQLIPSKREGANQVNLVATIQGTDHDVPPLVFNTHLDTVPPGNPALWTKCGEDPFRALVEDDRIYGLGAADTKLDFVAKVMAIASCGKPRRDVWLVATFGEEHGLVGAKEIAAAGLLPRGALAFIGEPSRLEVITAHKGLMVFALRIGFTPASASGAPKDYQRLSFAGRAAHSSTPALGLNAIKLALKALASRSDLRVCAIDGGDAVNKVPAYCAAIVEDPGSPPLPDARTESIDKASDSTIPTETIVAAARFIAALQEYADAAGSQESDYASPALTCNPGVIRTNPDSLVLDFELRPPPGLALGTVRDGVAAMARKTASQNPKVTLELEEKRANPGFRSPLDSSTVELALKALAAAGLPLKTNVKAGCTEAGVYAAAGLKPIVFGPGPSTGVIHAPNEYNLVADVEGAVRFYQELMRL
jgi:acetylornithine deacetylase/succinyl-diaminopimelate desuccinylase-like protein